MGLDDYFENKKTHRRIQRHHKYYDDVKYPADSWHSFNGYGYDSKWLRIVKTIISNKKLKLLVLLAGLALIVLIIVLVIVIMPVMIKLTNYIMQNGLQGVFNGIVDFLDKIWKGSAQ